MKPVVAAVIGAGYISQFHLEGLAAAGAEIRWVCDLDAERAAKAASGYGAKPAADLDAVLADPEVNLVVVTAVTRAHRDICLAAIAAGKNVVCEKTLSMNEAEAREITQAAEARRVLFFTSYMKRFFPATRKAKELLPQLGEIFSATVQTFQPWGDLWTRVPEGFLGPDGMSHNRRALGGGMLPAGGSHLLDIMMHLLGRPERLYAYFRIRDGLDIELQTEALMEVPGAGAVFFEAVAHPYMQSGPAHDGWDEHIRINGVHGRLDLYYTFWDRFMHLAPWVEHYDCRSGETVKYAFRPESPFIAAEEYFCRRVAEGSQGDYSLYAGYDVDCLIDALVRSGTERRPVDLAWPGR